MRAQGDDAAGEVVGYGTYEEDGPVTWETLTFPREVAVCGVPQQNLREPQCLGECTRSLVKNEPLTPEVGQRQGEPEQRPMGVRESEGRI